MEREICQYLVWELNVEPSTLKEFEDMVRKDFAGPEPYPTYVCKNILFPPSFRIQIRVPSHLSVHGRLRHQVPTSPPTTPDTPEPCHLGLTPQALSV